MIPTSIVCTVFEGAYHYGVAGLANSLYACGYRGVLYAGYRGTLPPWAEPARTDAAGHTLYAVAEGLDIRFAPQATGQILANIKPDLMKEAWSHYPEAEFMFYIDCDILLKSRWNYLEEWAGYGVALVEDMASPIAPSHPLRQQWRAYYARFGVDYVPKDDVYVNGGFVGLHRRYRDFADCWQRMQEYMNEATGLRQQIKIADRWNLFHNTDQDALNVAKDLTEHVSIMGPPAMDFRYYGYVMSHATGRKKPWTVSYLREIILHGSRPGYADKQYWQHVEGPIQLFSPFTATRKRLALRFASFIGRFFTRV